MTNSSAILEINLKNFIHNYKSLSKISSKSLIGATIKANAYGLGDLKIFKILYKNGCKNFFVATLDEGLNIRKKFLNGNIFILNGFEKDDIKICLKNKLIPIINSIEELKILNNNSYKNINIGLHIDSGINRLGIQPKNVNNLLLSNFKIKLLMSHLSSSEEKHNKYNSFQNKVFMETFKHFNNVKYKSIANSMGIILGNKYHYNLVRPGISLYGGHYNTKMKNIIKPVIKLKAKVLQIKHLKKNEYVGYNQTYKTKKITSIAILGIGYADGISRVLSNKGFVYYKNKKFKIIGRISMDSLTIDISANSMIIKKGVYMELINYRNDIEKIAKECNTISNEILTSISSRVKRIYR